MLKRKIALALAATMMLSALAGCAGDGKNTSSTSSSSTSSSTTSSTAPTEGTKTAEELIVEPYEETVTINCVLGYRDSENADTPDDVTPETQTAVKLLKDKLNIDLKYTWIVNNDQYEEKFGAELAAGTLPDVFMLGANDFDDIASQGGLADLTDAYAQYRTSNIDSVVNYDGNIINSAKRDDKIYGLPNSIDPAQMTSQMYYNMTLLKQAGITSEDQLPKTIEEFEALCDKLLTLDIDGNGKTGDPIMPACKNYMDAQLGDFTPFFHAYEAWNSGWYDNGSGALQYAGVDKSLIEPITMLNEWYNKGYFAKDFAAYDIWAADSPIVSDIVSNKYAIVQGSWWIPNWPLNSNVKDNPDSNWVVGPNLSPDGSQPTIMIDRYPISNFTVVGRDCKNPEAIFKMINLSLEYEREIRNPEYVSNMTPEQKLESDSYVYIWLPYRTYCATSLRENYKFINDAIAAGKETVSVEEAPINNEFWGAWSSYLTYKSTPDDPMAWGTWFSRIAPEGGVANMVKTVESADIQYDEVYVTTPSMITKQGELDKYRDNTILSMIMGETPITDFDKYVSEWKAQGGADIEKEVNEWYASTK